jgi:hypothetical protein
MQDLKIKEQVDLNKLPEDAVHALKILDELENFTAELRKKLMAELRPGGNVVRLKLEDI